MFCRVCCIGSTLIQGKSDWWDELYISMCLNVFRVKCKNVPRKWDSTIMYCDETTTYLCNDIQRRGKNVTDVGVQDHADSTKPFAWVSELFSCDILLSLLLLLWIIFCETLTFTSCDIISLPSVCGVNNISGCNSYFM